MEILDRSPRRPRLRLVAALAALVAAWIAVAWQPALSPLGPWGSPLLLGTLTLAAAVLAAHRPFGVPGLGAGTLVLPLAAATAGVGPTMVVAAAARLAAMVAVLGLAGRGWPERGWRGRSSPAPIARTGRAGDWDETPRALVGGVVTVGFATLAAAVVQLRWPVEAWGADLWSSVLPPVAYAAVWLLADLTMGALGGGPLGSGVARTVSSTGASAVAASPAAAGWRPAAVWLEAAGWWLGLNLAAAVAAIGWGRLWPLVLALVAASAAAAWSASRHVRAETRTRELKQLQGAHQRILAETSGKAAVASQILIECANVLPVHTYQLELFEGDGTRRSFAAGPRGVLTEGEPQPPTQPPMLPGIHRRSDWRLIEHALTLAGTEAAGEAIGDREPEPLERLGTLRLWCDPRRLEGGAEELLASLVPLMASSLHRARLDREAKHDTLTGLPVRRVLQSRMQKIYRTSCAEGQPMAVILCDVDHFKRINDTYGHDAGDAALIQIARMLDRHRRGRDLCCRYGGEEFTVLLEDTSGDQALALAERLRVAVESLAFDYDGQTIPLRISAGVASFPELHIKTVSELLLLADEALYAAKDAGRNRCLLHLGRGHFREPDGSPYQSPSALAPTSPASLPRIFS